MEQSGFRPEDDANYQRASLRLAASHRRLGTRDLGAGLTKATRSHRAYRLVRTCRPGLIRLVQSRVETMEGQSLNKGVPISLRLSKRSRAAYRHRIRQKAEEDRDEASDFSRGRASASRPVLIPENAVVTIRRIGEARPIDLCARQASVGRNRANRASGADLADAGACSPRVHVPTARPD
jgi:hypothetical protein